MAARAETPGKEERGPRIGAPPQALEGFLRKHGATQDQLTQEGQFWVLAKPAEVTLATELLARAVPAVLRAFPWPKSMRWGSSDFAWVRPLQRILCLFDGAAGALRPGPWRRCRARAGRRRPDRGPPHPGRHRRPSRCTDFADYEAGPARPLRHRRRRPSGSG